MGQRAQPVDQIGTGGQLLGRPRDDRVRRIVADAVTRLDQFALGVAAHQHETIAQAEQPVEHCDRLRAGRDVASDDDALGAGDVGFARTASTAGSTPWVSDSTATRLDHQLSLPRQRTGASAVR